MTTSPYPTPPPETDLDAILDAAERAVDSHPDLSRFSKGSEMPYEGELRYSRDGGWTVRVMTRNVRAKGRGSTYMSPLCGDGNSPESALASFIERLPIWAEALK